MSITVSISLHPAADRLETQLLAVSDPSSPNWRNFLSPSQAADLLSSPAPAVSNVQNWLTSAGVNGSLQGDAIVASATVAKVQKLLNCTYTIYGDGSGTHALRTDAYYVPDNLQNAVRYVSPGVHFPVPIAAQIADTSAKKQRRRRQIPRSARHLVTRGSNDTIAQACSNANQSSVLVTPECYKAVYGIDMSGTSNPQPSLAILDSDANVFGSEDIQQFMTKYAPQASNATFEIVPGPNFDDSEAFLSGEADLDTQTSLGLVAAAVGPAAAHAGTFYAVNLTGAYGEISSGMSRHVEATGEGAFIKFLKGLLVNETVPSVVSLSAGSNEGFVPVAYAHRACALIGAAGARGVTFIVSSGDWGPLGSLNANHATPVDPNFPAACPWVLAVGATANPLNETAMTTTTGRLVSGGGFSNIYNRPAYQKDVVGAYVDHSIDESFKDLPGFNETGRGYPDVAALGAYVAMVYQGVDGPAFGTSAAAPAWAAIIALLNANEISKGRPCVGFPNPWLYSLAAQGRGLKDITVGDGNDFVLHASAGPLDAPNPTRGYNATVGWDALTGLGVPIWKDLVAALS